MLGRLASLDLAGFLIRLLVNAVGLAVAAWVLPGITVANGTALLLGLTSWIAGRLEIGFHVDGFGAAVLGSIVISIVSWLLNRFTD